MESGKNLAILVFREKVEETHQWLVQQHLLDINRKIQISADGNFAEIPVLGEVDGYNSIKQDSPEYYLRFKGLKERLRDEVDPNQLKFVPSGWQIIGGIIVITIPDEISSLSHVIGKKLLEMYPTCHCVVRDLGIMGKLRQPVREIIAGEGTETTLKENGCFFKLDVTKVMYSKGNLNEKKYMSKTGAGETIVDMFAGIGYFSIPMAVHAKPKKIYSIELNPESYSYLLKNIRLNQVDPIIKPIFGDCSIQTPEAVADRVLMGYVGNTQDYLEKAVSAIKKEGGIIHYHESVPENLLPERPVARIIEAARNKRRNVTILGYRRIKKYSPGVCHVVVDAMIN